MAFFKNFFVVIILVGILTRVANYFYGKILEKEVVAYLSFATVCFTILPFVAYFVGFDIAFAEYIIALIIWLLFDLLRAGGK